MLPPIAAILTFTISGCSSGAKASTSVTPTISVSLTQTPPSSMTVSGSAPVSATVSDDIANAGVDWVAICGSAPACGSFSPPHTASGATSTFTAPAGVPSGNTVAVTAMSATDHSKTFAAMVTVISSVTGVTITEAPPTTYASGGSIHVAATVAGDPTNAGVDWKATCGTLDCTSSFIGNHSAPGIPTTFVVPIQSASYPNIIGSVVTLTAYATADRNFSASANFTVTAPISVTITQPPPNTVPINASVPVIAQVANDPTNSGVTWTILSCDVSPCGSWSGTSTVLSKQVANGATVIYFAPPTAVGDVKLQAAATASPVNSVVVVEISVVAPISVTITQDVPNNTIVKAGSAPLSATLENDATNAGVDWTVTCSNPGACGSFSPTHTASGATTTFTAPSAIPSGNTVTITATSTADSTKNASQTVTVTANLAPNSLLLRQFVIALSGKNANGGPFALGGVIVGDGLGNITKGTLDLADLQNAGNVGVLSSTYSMGTDARGQIQLKVNTSTLSGNFGVNSSGSIILSVVFVTPNHALLSETDSFGSGTGTLDLQSSTDLASFQNLSAGPNGVYSLSLTGAEVAGTNPKYFVAAALTLKVSGNTYSETAYVADQSDKGVITSIPFQQIAHAFANPLPSSYGELQLDAVNLGLPTKFSLNAWLIDANHFVVTDWRDSFSGSPSVIIIGYLTAQPSSSAFSGNYGFTLSGETASPSLDPQVVGGIFTCGAAGTLDVIPFLGTPVTDQTINAVCNSPVNGRGLLTVGGTGSTKIRTFAAYPTLDQGFYLIELDGGVAGTAGPSGAGMARQQTLTPPISASALNGDYGSTFLASTPLGIEGFAGQIVSDGASVLSGTADVNTFTTANPTVGTPSFNATLLGSFTASDNGRFPLTFMITPATGQPTPEIHRIDGACYIVDANTCLFIDLDAPAPAVGVLQLQQTGL